MTIGEGDEPFLWLFFEVNRIGLYSSDYSEVSVFDLT